MALLGSHSASEGSSANLVVLLAHHPARPISKKPQLLRFLLRLVLYFEGLSRCLDPTPECGRQLTACPEPCLRIANFNLTQST
jgi:hypothetical protein